VPTVRHTARRHACRSVARGPVRSCVHEKYFCGARWVYAGSMTGIRPEAGDRCFRGSVKGAPVASAGVIVTVLRHEQRRSPPWQGLPERLADAPPGGETVSPGVGLRSAHAGPASAAMSIATADRTSPHRLTTTPQRPHMCRAIHLRARWLSCLAAVRHGGGGMSREATYPCSRRLADAAGLVVSSNAAVQAASRGIDFGVTYVAY
jgi:hypothetical protein